MGGSLIPTYTERPGMARTALASSVDALKQVLARVKRALTVREEFFDLDLTVPETRTVASEGDVGGRRRPPTLLRCPDCAMEIRQRRPIDPIDCQTCPTRLPPDALTDLELVGLICPRCGSGMDHGTRHPGAIDGPQWATCPGCQYHWEYSHGG